MKFLALLLWIVSLPTFCFGLEHFSDFDGKLAASAGLFGLMYGVKTWNEEKGNHD